MARSVFGTLPVEWRPTGVGAVHERHGRGGGEGCLGGRIHRTWRGMEWVWGMTERVAPGVMPRAQDNR